jgi:nitrate reductase assembly molybdenum cofactor insertion protein NarJ
MEIMPNDTAINIQSNPPMSAGLATDYALFAELFTYPANEQSYSRIREAYARLCAQAPEMMDLSEAFGQFLEAATMVEFQEVFLRTFDVQAITTLDIGFTLFGEDYKRGQLLVHLNQEHREAGNDCFTELSDHLPNVLRLIQRMEKDELRTELVQSMLIPVLRKMIGEFSTDKMDKKDEVYKKNLKAVLDFSQPYRTVFKSLLQSLNLAMIGDFGEGETAEELVVENWNADIPSACGIGGGCSSSPGTGDFSRMIEDEMNIEKD